MSMTIVAEDCSETDYDMSSILKQSPASRKGSTVHSRLTELIDILDLEQIEENVFRGRHQVENRNRLYDHALWFHDPDGAGGSMDTLCAMTRRLVQRQEDIIAVQCLAKVVI